MGVAISCQLWSDMVLLLPLTVVLLLQWNEAGYSVECDETGGEWGEWGTTVGLHQTRTRSTYQKRTDPKRNIGGRVMTSSSIRYPDVLKQAYLARLKKIVC